ncbi:MAG: SPFH domain-containing protein [Gloeomargarita sp. SKYBB_i_bin120]|nr:SPFH domain-containing protein [Gloeomargarita sp. SKYG98]MCS7292044.1 SPFH domain-containing protein [Gloeomargarita sp. SKYB120]MDW8177604.1 SPFH domain-containing protein [Gloeomargarita sp. SKYBB_i_bin120]
MLLIAFGQPSLDIEKKLQERMPWLVAALVGMAVWGKVVGGVRVAADWEKGVILTLGRFSEIRGPGVFYVLPLLETVRFVDTRVQVLNIPRQRAITRDNVPVMIDSALFIQREKPRLGGDPCAGLSLCHVAICPVGATGCGRRLFLG